MLKLIRDRFTLLELQFAFVIGRFFNQIKTNIKLKKETTII